MRRGQQSCAYCLDFAPNGLGLGITYFSGCLTASVSIRRRRIAGATDFRRVQIPVEGEAVTVNAVYFEGTAFEARLAAAAKDLSSYNAGHRCPYSCRRSLPRSHAVDADQDVRHGEAVLSRQSTHRTVVGPAPARVDSVMAHLGTRPAACADPRVGARRLPVPLGARSTRNQTL